MTTHITKTWIEDGKLITEIVPQESIYKREWVGLTDKEYSILAERYTGADGLDCVDYGRAIEAKLKEKNHG